ncbi:Uncharacterised protein [Flavonifractor plautii]|uniref:Uncharacterized protein n=1 Tax=Flavonifractor plautii TaxID=292800 RepID=A0A174UEY3_FLAPL|nr:Uncharacterised protein [Flavonifractor plautii]
MHTSIPGRASRLAKKALIASSPSRTASIRTATAPLSATVPHSPQETQADSRLSTRSTQHQTRSSRERVLRTVLRRALASADSALRS